MLNDRKNKLTLIVDGNWLLMSRISVLRSNNYFSELELAKSLKLIMVQSMKNVLKTFPEIDNIVFVADGGSWRKTVAVPDFLAKNGVTYKGNRKLDDGIDWKIVFNEYNDFINTLSSTGISTYQAEDVEGDDWCWYLSTKLNSEGINCIIWSRDKDLTQLVHTNENSCFTGWWNVDTGLYIEDKSADDMDFFFNIECSENEKLLDNVIKRTKFTKINPKNIVIDKIIKGDDGDNILPIIQRETESGKLYKIGNKELDFTIDINNDNSVKAFIAGILNSKKYLGKVNKTQEDIIKHFKYNKQLVELTDSSYPEKIKETLSSNFKYTVSNNLKPMLEIMTAQQHANINILETI